MQRRYLIVSPCRDEADYARKALESVVSQSVLPALWLIVDDGSTDATPEFLEEFSSQHDFIRVLRREDRGKRSVGPGVVEAFYAGLDTLDLSEFDYLCKLDLDLDLPPRYFETLIRRMEENPRIGTCSGKPYVPSEDGKLVSEACGDEMSVGMTKFYRTPCFQEIGGFVREVMWDGIDCHRCRMLGWIAVSWDEPDLRFVHLRHEGSSQQSIWTGRNRHGFGQYFMGTGFPYMFASAVFRMTRHPYLVGGLGMLVGYVKAMFRRVPRYGDSEFRRFLRRYQWGCLIRGKGEATRRLNEKQAEVWKARNE